MVCERVGGGQGKHVRYNSLAKLGYIMLEMLNLVINPTQAIRERKRGKN